MQFDMAGMPMQMPPMKNTRCVTQQEIDSPNRGLPSGPAKNPNDCKVSDHKVSGNTITWTMTCAGAQPMTGTGELRFTGELVRGHRQDGDGPERNGNEALGQAAGGMHSVVGSW